MEGYSKDLNLEMCSHARSKHLFLLDIIEYLNCFCRFKLFSFVISFLHFIEITK